MANVQHVDITDPEIHEPKGVASASAGTVYVADGSGSGTWEKVDTTSLEYANLVTDLQADIDSGDIELSGQYSIYATIADVSTASSILVPVLKNSTFKRATLVLGGAITVADSVVSFKNSSGSSMGTSATIAYTSSAKGSTFSFTATSNNTLTAPTYIEIATDGGSTTAQPLYILMEFTAQFN